MNKDIIFNSPFELSQFIETKPTTTACNKYFASTKPCSKRDGRGWYGTETYEEADQLFKDGDTENAKKIVEAAIVFDKQQAQRAQRRGMSPAVVGCLPNVPAAIQGLPVAMYHRQPQPGRPVVHLDINCAVCSNIEPETIIKIGAVILSTVNQLEKNGHSVAIAIKCKSFFDGDTFTTSVVIKEAGQRFNASQLAYCLVNPSFLRRHLFAVWERTQRKKTFFRGYGKVSQSGDNLLHIQSIAERLQNRSIKEEEIFNTIKNALY